MKRKLLLLSVLVICAAIAAVGTLAFFNTKAVAHNVITTGGVDIELHEYADKACTTDYDTNKTGIMPGMTVDKYARIALAEGSADAWVRVKFEKKITFAAGNEHAQGKTPDLDLVELTMSLYAKKKKTEAQKRKFGAIDERYMKRAEDLLFGELSAALEIPKGDVRQYIHDRLQGKL